jgi:signal transduction histidine kinase
MQANINSMTEHKKNEAQILHSTKDWVGIFNTITDLITIHDKDFNIIHANKTAKEILRLPDLEINKEIKCFNYYHGTICPPEGCPSCDCVKTGIPAVFELFEPHLNKDIEIRAMPRFDNKNQIIGGIHMVRDITHRKQAEKQLKNSREKLRNLTAHLHSVREEERKIIAREIHDELAQALTALKMDLVWLNKKLPKDQKPLLEKAKLMSNLIDMTIYAIRRISSELRPGLLDDLGLQAAIEWQAKEFQDRTGITCEVSFYSDTDNLDQERTITIFRIFQETLTNIVRHAEATRVKASLKEINYTLVMEVMDNGVGITEEQISRPISFGIIGMQERALLLGGNIKISGVQGKGTTVIASIPFEKSRKKSGNFSQKGKEL